jgi:hypothetical protein
MFDAGLTVQNSDFNSDWIFYKTIIWFDLRFYILWVSRGFPQVSKKDFIEISWFFKMILMTL